VCWTGKRRLPSRFRHPDSRNPWPHCISVSRPRAVGWIQRYFIIFVHVTALGTVMYSRSRNSRVSLDTSC
jgi:hypothetical protein